MKQYVLIVDDDTDDVAFMQEVIEETNFPLHSRFVADGHEAIAFLNECQDDAPNLIMLDVYMPKIGGLEVLKYIRSTPRFKHIKVIMFSTGGADDHEVVEFNQAGADDFFVKPDTYGKLRDIFTDIKTRYTQQVINS